MLLWSGPVQGTGMSFLFYFWLLATALGRAVSGETTRKPPMLIVTQYLRKGHLATMGYITPCCKEPLSSLSRLTKRSGQIKAMIVGAQGSSLLLTDVTASMV